MTASLKGEVSAAAQALLDAGRAQSMSQEALEAVRDGRIHVQPAWRSGLPGNPPLLAVPDVENGVLTRTPMEGNMPANSRRPWLRGITGCCRRPGWTASG